MTAYNRVAAALREQILTGSWEGTNQLPTERELCDQFSASRITIRRALLILEEEQLVERRQGVGTFIKSNPTRKIPLLSTDYFGSIQSHAPDLTRSVNYLRTVKADPDVAQRLNLFPNDDVIEAVRIDSLREEPIATDQLYLVRRLADKLDESHLTEMNFLSAWSRRQRIDLDYCTQTIEARKATREIAQLLGIKTGDIVLKETNVVSVVGGLAAGLFITHYRHDVFRFETTIDLRSRGLIAKRHG